MYIYICIYMYIYIYICIYIVICTLMSDLDVTFQLDMHVMFLPRPLATQAPVAGG